MPYHTIPYHTISYHTQVIIYSYDSERMSDFDEAILQAGLQTSNITLLNLLSHAIQCDRIDLASDALSAQSAEKRENVGDAWYGMV